MAIFFGRKKLAEKIYRRVRPEFVNPDGNSGIPDGYEGGIVRGG